MLRTYRSKVLALLVLAGGLAAGVVIWQATTGTTTITGGTTGGGDVFTEGKDVAACTEQARAFTDYPLLWAGPSVLGYPLVHCAHMMTKTRYAPDGSISHPGGDAWVFGYGTCTPGEGQESCPLPVTIRMDPCAGIVDGRTIPKGSQPVRSAIVRGAKADISKDGVLSFEQSPQSIQIYAPEGPADDRAAQAVKVAEALVAANPPASAAASAVSPDVLIGATLNATKVECP